MAVNDIYRAVQYCTGGDQQAVNVFYFRTVAESGAGAPQGAIASALGTTLGARMRDMMSVNVVFQGWSVAKIHPTAAAMPSFSGVNQGFGAQASEPLPYQVCTAVTWTTGFAGRAWRGRSYLPFPPETASNELGQPTQPHKDFVTAYANAIRSFGIVGLVGAQTTLEMVLKQFDKELGVNQYVDITGHVVRPYFTTQRRRGRASGGDPIIGIPPA